MACSVHSVLFVALLCLCCVAEAKDHLVGGSTNAWKVPPSSSLESLNRWAEANRFSIGDSLVWKFDGKKDSVLQVDREDYSNCNTANPISESKDGNTSVKLEKSGPYYFISGAKGACEKGERVIVIVMSLRHGYVISPAPSPVEFDGPAVPPTSGASQLELIRRGFVGCLVFFGMMGLLL